MIKPDDDDKKRDQRRGLEYAPRVGYLHNPYIICVYARKGREQGVLRIAYAPS